MHHVAARPRGNLTHHPRLPAGRGTRLRICGSGVRILSGAPLSTHLRTSFACGLSGKDGVLKNILAALDAYLMVVHLDDLDEGLQVRFPKGHRSAGELLTHATTEPLHKRRIDTDERNSM